MLTFNGFGQRRRPKHPRIEVLESRTLMTRAFAPGLVETVRLVELDLPDAEPDEESDSVSLDELPEAVLSAVFSRFPQARILTAVAGVADGPLEYELQTEFQGTEYSVSVLADGALVDVQRSIAVTELPTAVTKWFVEQFPAATIREARHVTMDGLSRYELDLVDTGETTLEATVELDDRDLSLALAVAADVRQQQSVDRNRPDRGGSGLRPQERDSDVTRGQSDIDHDPVTSAAAVDAITTSAPVASEKTGSGDAAVVRLNPLNATRRRGDSAEHGITADVIPASSRLPDEGALRDALPVDFATIEQALEQFLNEFELLTEHLSSRAVVRRWWPVVAAVSALVGIERLISDRRRTDADVVRATAGSSWSWILRLSTHNGSRGV